MKSKLFKHLFIGAILLPVMFSCKKDEQPADTGEGPVIEVTSKEMEGLPGETVNLTAKITDGIGIDYIMLESMDWEFSNRIDFSDQNYIREYDLSESIVIPDQVARGDIGEVFIRVFDHAGRDAEQMVEVVVTPEPARLSIVQEMGFSIIIPGLKASVSGNDVTFAPVVGGAQLPVKLNLSSNKTRLSKLTVVCEALEIDEEIDLTAISTDEGRTAVFEKTYSINASGDEKNEVVFTLFDEKGNTATYNPMVAVKATFEGHNLKHSALFIKDLSVDMSKVVFGLPMLAERKLEASDKFTARFWSPAPNTEIVFLSSRNAEDQVTYGISNDNKYFIKSDNPKPIVLPEKGYYEISINLLEGLYEVKALGRQESRWSAMTFVPGWSATWLSMNQQDATDTPSLWSVDCDLGKTGGFDVAFGNDLPGNNDNKWVVAAGTAETEPEVWVYKPDKDKYPQYNGWFFDTKLPSKEIGEVTVVFDDFLMRAYAIQK